MKYLSFNTKNESGKNYRGLILVCLPGDRWYKTIQTQDREEIETLIKRVQASVPVPSLPEEVENTIVGMRKDNIYIVGQLSGIQSEVEVCQIFDIYAQYVFKNYPTLEDVPADLYEPEPTYVPAQIQEDAENQTTKRNSLQTYILPKLSILYEFTKLSGTVKEWEGRFYLVTQSDLDDFFDRAEDREIYRIILPDVSQLYQSQK